MTVFCCSEVLLALNDRDEWFERAVALGDLIEDGLIVPVYEHDYFAGFIDNTARAADVGTG
jgi:hypothetical protein